MAKFKNENGEELSLDDILNDSEYQAEFDKKVAKALEKNKIDVNTEVQKQLEAALAGREAEIRKNIQDDIEKQRLEAEENAKLTEAEKHKKEVDKLNQQLLEANAKVAVANREKAVDKYIKEKGYDRDAILEFIDVASLPDTFQDKLDSINEKLNARISAGVNDRLKDVDEKVLGNKGKGEGPTFDFNFQPIKSTK